MGAAATADDDTFVDDSSLADRPSRSSGQDIRARIEANRRKRLAFANAMKREAGVVEHNVWAKESEGLAELAHARIHSPAGRNLRELYIVAHECGHIFLHGSGQGRRLPAHVMELEAETYAHHAFRHYGMKVPKEVTRFSRWYVGTWIEKDRASGIRIDPRAEAFARGERSPFEPLRMVPLTWRGVGELLPPEAQPAKSFAAASLGVWSGFWYAIRTDAIWLEGSYLARIAAMHTLLAHFAGLLIKGSFPDSVVRKMLMPSPITYDANMRELFEAYTFGLLWTAVVLLGYTMVRPHGGFRRWRQK